MGTARRPNRIAPCVSVASLVLAGVSQRHYLQVRRMGWNTLLNHSRLLSCCCRIRTGGLYSVSSRDRLRFFYVAMLLKLCSLRGQLQKLPGSCLTSRGVPWCTAHYSWSQNCNLCNMIHAYGSTPPLAFVTASVILTIMSSTTSQLCMCDRINEAQSFQRSKK